MLHLAKWRDIELNGRTFRSFGFFLKKDTPSYDFTSMSIKSYAVQGSVTGQSITLDTPQNIERTYNFRSIPSEVKISDESRFKSEFTDWINALMISSQNIQLKDSDKKGYFTNCVISKITPLIKNFDKCYDFSITLICKPYWYADEGETLITKTFSTSDSAQDKVLWLYNPEIFRAYPLITIQFSGSSSNGLLIKTFNAGYSTYVGDLINQFQVLNIESRITLNSENKRSYKGAQPQDHKLNLQDYPTFPFFEKGKNKIEFETSGQGNFEVIIRPRWRCY